MTTDSTGAVVDPMESIEITSDRDAALVTFQVPCLCDTDTITHAGVKLRTYIDAHHPTRMIFDFEKVKFFSSQVLGLILEARSKCLSYEGRVVISAINPQLHRVFRITNLDRIFEFFPDKQSALQVSPTS